MKVKHIHALLKRKIKTGGRNKEGTITIRHIGGGHKQYIRHIDFKRNIINSPGIVLRIEKDPTRTTNVALICYPDGILTYILAPEALKIGSSIIASQKTNNAIGNSMFLGNILLGTLIHNVEAMPGKGGTYARSAGNYALLISKSSSGLVTIKLPSGELKQLSQYCSATLGIVANIQKHMQKRKNAGYSRHIGKRPTVRGVAMNPVDHPHGGGEGKSGPGRPSVSYTGIPTKGKKTRKNKKANIIKKRHGI